MENIYDSHVSVFFSYIFSIILYSLYSYIFFSNKYLAKKMLQSLPDLA